jgi:hypothetical protein
LVVKLVDTQDLKSCGCNGRAGSSPAQGTNKQLFQGCFFCFARFQIIKKNITYCKRMKTQYL